MKKTNKPNPLKFFNDNNAAAYKKAGGAMKSFNKNLKKAQDGMPMVYNEYVPPYPGYKHPERITKGYEKTYQGPLNKAEQKATDKLVMSPPMQNYMRAPQQSEASYEANKQKKGGPVKKKMQNGGTTATRGKTKYEYGNTPYTPGGPNQVFVNKTKTKRSGKTVATNATNELTNSGFKTTIKKTTTDKSGNSKTKDVKGTGSNFNKLLRQGQRATELQRAKAKVKKGGPVKRKK